MIYGYARCSTSESRREKFFIVLPPVFAFILPQLRIMPVVDGAKVCYNKRG